MQVKHRRPSATFFLLVRKQGKKLNEKQTSSHSSDATLRDSSEEAVGAAGQKQ